MKTEHLQVRLSAIDKKGLEELAKKRDMSMSELIIYLIRREIDKEKEG